MLGPIKYNLSHLLDFAGRDARQTFWFYVLFLFILNIGLGMVLGIVMAGSLMAPALEAAQAGASDEAMRAQMMASMSGFLDNIMCYAIALNAIMCLLLAASFVRRLHDSNSTGWWGVLTLAAVLAGSLVSIRMFSVMHQLMSGVMSQPGALNPAEMRGMMQAQSQIGVYGFVGWIAPILVIVFGVMPSTEGPNRYGAEPVRF